MNNYILRRGTEHPNESFISAIIINPKEIISDTWFLVIIEIGEAPHFHCFVLHPPLPQSSPQTAFFSQPMYGVDKERNGGSRVLSLVLIIARHSFLFPGPQFLHLHMLVTQMIFLNCN